MTPLEAWQHDLEHRNFHLDPIQQMAVDKTQALYERLINEPVLKRSNGLFSFLNKKTANSIKGLYFWGGVGRGKSYILDTFFGCLPFPEKKRVHFNQLMQDIHEKLKFLPKTPDPLIIIANEIAQECRVLCIDEFHVDDITDAMIMTGLLNALFDEGVTLVTSSNIEPTLLYKNGLQRDRFLPAIALIESHTEVVHLNNDTDYRRQLLTHKDCFYVGDDHAQESIQQLWMDLSDQSEISASGIIVNSRELQCIAKTDTQIWFSFSSICETARSSVDYMRLAEQFESFFISDIPIMYDSNNDVVQRFIQLIDALYDKHVNLIASAAAEPQALYQGKGLTFPFQRTISRLHEMRSTAYKNDA